MLLALAKPLSVRLDVRRLENVGGEAPGYVGTVIHKMGSELSYWAMEPHVLIVWGKASLAVPRYSEPQTQDGKYSLPTAVVRAVATFGMVGDTRSRILDAIYS